MAIRQEEGIEGQDIFWMLRYLLEEIIDERNEYFSEKWAWLFKVGVGVDLDQIYI